ncbi:head maturation protease [Salmonella phage 1-19]|uniref:Putative prohead protease n=3 Tax=Epseptimavirus TaxID=2732017 RepID=A0A5C2ICC8_9CAUD|nr:head maturation protease [Salmonella phage 1-29]YP_009853235.1 head maturation protease [Salmonella phage 1-19]QEP52557.1 putative prohead protease [Salmonella phage 9-29]QIN92621.1 capsid and scaffold protein [Phage NBSal002]QEP52777.1 putative prohead protease [Salmonella phage 1-29]QFR58166.1 putative prohead protease [Salmonella phage 1-19]
MTNAAIDYNKLKSAPVHLDAYIKSIDSESKEGVVKIRGFANTISKDRAGDVIPASAWKTSNALANYMKNPIILFGHDHRRPIGKCIDLNPTEMGLEIECEIYESSDPAIFSLIKNGVLKTFSIGFRCLDAEWDEATDIFIIKDLELYEVSVVSVPCNQDSTFNLAKSMNGHDYTEWRKSFTATSSKAAPAQERNLSELEKLAIALGYVKE